MTGERVQQAGARAPGQASPQALLQRKCACGMYTPGGGSCRSCEGEAARGLQRKLRIGPANDVHEQEADRVAELVLAGPAPAGLAASPVAVRRFPSSASGGTEAVPPSVERTLAAPGATLDQATRRDMEDRFGRDFSRVRVHHDGPAAQSAREVHAKAYTVGDHVVFGQGQFAPGTEAGRRLLAHELTHVVQQSAGTLRLQRQCVQSPCPPSVPIDALFPRYEAAEKCIQTLYQRTHPAAKPGVSLSFNADWLHLTGGNSQEKLALGCLRGEGVPEPGTKGAGPNMTAKGGMVAAAPDIWDFRAGTMYEITTLSGAPLRLGKLGAQITLANKLCGTADCGGLQFDRGPWSPAAGCYSLGGDLYFTAYNNNGVIIYQMLKDVTKELVAAALLAAMAAAAKNLPKAGGAAVAAGAKRLVPAYAVASLIIAAGLLASGKAEARPGPGEEPIESLFKALEQKGTPLPPELREMIEADPALKEMMSKALREGGDIPAAQEAINKQILETIAANKDQFTPEELEVLLASAQAVGGALPKGAMTVAELKSAAAAAKTGGDGSGRDGAGKAAADGKPATPSAPPAEPVTAATRKKLGDSADPVRQLYAGITVKTEKSRLTDAQLRRFLDMVPPDISAERVARLLEMVKKGLADSPDQALDRLQAALEAPEGTGAPAGDDAPSAPPAEGGKAATPGPAPATQEAPRPGATQTIGPTVDGGKQKTDPQVVIKQLAAQAAKASFRDLGKGEYRITWRRKAKEPLAKGSDISGSLRGKRADGRTYFGRIEAEVTGVEGSKVTLKFITATPMVSAKGEIIYEPSHFLGREQTLTLDAPKKKGAKK
jgi:hypothetical protein